MRDTIRPLVEEDPAATWVTIGDGNYGSDAYDLRSRGAKVIATSLTDSTLVVAAAEGYLDAYRSENAESLTFENASIDYLSCKEAYHHFPRPALAFYEMFRCAR